MAIVGFRDTSNGDWYQIYPNESSAAIQDISIQNLNSEYDIYVAPQEDWGNVGMVIKPNQIVSFEGLSNGMSLFVNDDGNGCEMAVMLIQR